MKTKTQHTPGPWDLVFRQHHTFVESLATGCGNVATVSEGRSVAESAANARLIAAAPELLEAAGAVLDGNDAGDCIENQEANMELLRSAIAKSEGR